MGISFWVFTVGVIVFAAWGLVLQVYERKMLFERRHVTGISSFMIQCFAGALGFFWFNNYSETLLLLLDGEGGLSGFAGIMIAAGTFAWITILAAGHFLIRYLVKDKNVSGENRNKKLETGNG